MKFLSRFFLCFFILLPVLNGAAGGRTMRTAKIPDPNPDTEIAGPFTAADDTAGESPEGGYQNNQSISSGQIPLVAQSETASPATTPPATTPAGTIPSGNTPLGNTQPETMPAEAPNQGAAVESRAEKVVRALAAAYPDRMGEAEFIDGDWTVTVYGERFYYAEGRLLPESLRDKAKEYDPQPFYNYPVDLPPWKDPTPEESERIKEQEKIRRSRPAKRSTQFYDTLWRIHNQEESWDHVKQIRFLGHPVMVHYSILTQLSLVEEQILQLAKTDSAVRQWINNIKSIDGWNWRNIAESQSRSYHAYGAAIDFLPVSLGGLQTYWLWTSQYSPEWWAVPYTKRYQPPPEVVKAFESFGFVWGGKWRYFDTMHFEYRPEILALSGIPQTDPRDLR